MSCDIPSHVSNHVLLITEAYPCCSTHTKEGAGKEIINVEFLFVNKHDIGLNHSTSEHKLINHTLKKIIPAIDQKNSSRSFPCSAKGHGRTNFRRSRPYGFYTNKSTNENSNHQNPPLIPMFVA